MRLLPIGLSICLIVGISEKNGKKSRIHNSAMVMVSITGNVLFWLCMHYYFYRDFDITNYIRKIWELDFYHNDIEFFAFSTFCSIVAAIAIGIILVRLFDKKHITWSLNNRQEKAIIFSCACSFTIVLGSLFAQDFYNSKIQITEICSNNKNIVTDENGSKNDYIELYNDNIFPCQIEGLYLSDNKYELKKMSLDGIEIEPYSYTIVSCVDEQGSFSINKEGDTIFFSNEDGMILEQITLMEMQEGFTYCKKMGTTQWGLMPCSAGMRNYESKLEKPTMSSESGFYDNDFWLEITGETGTTIYYTLDGSIPDENSLRYEEPIHVYDKSEEENVWSSVQNVVLDWKNYYPDMTPVPKAFIIRAIALDENYNKSDIVTATYFVGDFGYEDKNVISLIADPDDLFGDNGIYVTGKEYDDWYLSNQKEDEPMPMFRVSGRISERPAVMEIFEASESLFQQEVGIRIHGGSTRKAAKKRFSVYAREEYSGSERFESSFFDDGIQLHSTVLRESLEDVICQDLFANRDICTERGKAVTVYLNGEYWYDVYIRDKYSKLFFEDYYGINRDDLIVFKAGLLDEGLKTDEKLYKQLFDFVEINDLANDVNYKQLTEMMDIQNYIDFICANVYLNNMDIDNEKNTIMWRSRITNGDGYNDGKWRWALHDMDWISSLQKWHMDKYGVDNIARIDSFSEMPIYAEVPINQLTIYKQLKENETFRKQFVLTFMDLINHNFSKEVVEDTLKLYGEDITWLDSYFIKRPEYMISYLAKEFELKGTVETITLNNEDESKGVIQINTIIPKMKNGSWNGKYFTDYSVTLTAIPEEGYEFVGWSGSIVSKEATIELNIEKGLEIKAEFQKK